MNAILPTPIGSQPASPPSPIAAAVHSSAVPSLLNELVDLIAVYAIRAAAASTHWSDPNAIALPLNVLGRGAVPQATTAALTNMPHVDLDFASRCGSVALLDIMYNWFHIENEAGFSVPRPLQFTTTRVPNDLCVLDVVSGAGHVHVLEWWFAHPAMLALVEWSAVAIDLASMNGHLDVLKLWFGQSGLAREQLKYSHRALDGACAHGHVHVVNWWLCESGLSLDQLKYTKGAMDAACKIGRLDIVKVWFHKARADLGKLKYTAAALDAASANGSLDMLQFWFHESGLGRMGRNMLKFTEAAMDGASGNGHLHVLKWWVDESGLPHDRLKYSYRAVDCASGNGHWDILAWWFYESHTPLHLVRFSEAAMDAASRSGHVDTLDWWVQKSPLSPTELKYSKSAMGGATDNGHVHVLDWWVQSSVLQAKAEMVVGCAAFVSNGGIAGGAPRENEHVLKWCLLQHPKLLAQPDMCCFPGDWHPVTGAIVYKNLGLLLWLDLIEFTTMAESDMANASAAAAREGDMYALRWLKSHGWLIGTRVQLIQLAARAGNVRVLVWVHVNIEEGRPECIYWIDDDYKLDAFCSAMDSGNVRNVLEWLVEHGYRPASVKQCKHDLERAFSEGMADVVDWWVQYGCCDLKDIGRHKLLNLALGNALSCALAPDGLADALMILDYVRMSGFLMPDYFEGDEPVFLERLGEEGVLAVIEWWVERAGPEYLKLVPVAVYGASRTGKVHVLEYCLSRCGPFDDKVVHRAVHEAGIAAQIGVLEWWALHADISTYPVAVASQSLAATSVLWWSNNLARVEEKGKGSNGKIALNWSGTSVLIMDMVVRRGLLELEHKGGLVSALCAEGELNKLMYVYRVKPAVVRRSDAQDALLKASRGNCWPVLRWWKHVNLDVVLPEKMDKEMFESFAADIQRWWCETGLLK